MITTLDLAASLSDPVARRTLASLSLSVAKSKRIVVVTGAGISCSCGIPDFRSSDGLYALVKKQYPDTILKGRDLFDASLFRDPTSTSIFYTFISQLKQSIDVASPSRTHHFIRTLDEKKKLLRSYTQNIDGLEEKAGLIGSSGQGVKSNEKGKAKLRVKDVRNIQLHGDIHRVRCTLCSADLPCAEEYLQLFADGLAPDCPECTSRSEARLARSARPLRIGTLRPAIVLYDEAHPLGDDIGAIQAFDVSRKPDMLIIMGTSLKVHGLRRLVKEFAKVVHASAPPDPMSTKAQAKNWVGKVIFVNKTPPGSDWNGIIDYHIEGETDVWAYKVEEDWRKMRPSDWEVQQTLDEKDDGSAFKAMKDVVGKGIRKYLSLHPSLRLKRMLIVETCRWQTYSVWNGECPPSPGYRAIHCAAQSPLFPDEAAPVDVALHGWRLQSVEEAGSSWDF
ncbi:DHS-like NAD/FAD-binding domain-containing protein [Multifurca ochricompacta]|uniref:DHS-like NAD/FAD-binding domain-containing protein n=1 Tax=Multifurca ochricompacta TaxID=376703 RepID=A0AAD4MDT0_9AGAM|nr:DHS-like NAD/FAD-binding domain-containing protein [Multifurca ochricompacta]